MVGLGNLVYEDLVGRGRRMETAKRWSGWVSRFEGCCGIKGKYGREDVMKSLVDCRARGLKQNSINTVLRAVKLLAEIQGWDFPKMSMPVVRDSDVYRPLFSGEEVYEMIRRGKEVLLPSELAFLALGTVYGLRREEMTDLDISEKGKINGTVRIETVKGGVVTTHIIPGEVKPYLEGYKRNSVTYMSMVFQRMMCKLGVKVNGGGYGWHCFRRALITELVEKEVSMFNLLRFMRWSEGSLKSEFGMVAIYAKRDQGKVDEAIFKVHPFLPVWKEKGR